MLAATLALPACATSTGFQARTAGLIGAAEGGLAAALGVPTGMHEAEGRRFLESVDRRLIAFHGGRGCWGSAVETRLCATASAPRGGRMETFASRGNARVAPMPG